MFQILLETAPYRQWIIVTPRVRRVPSPTVLVPYTVVKYEYSYRKVLYLPVPYYRIEPTTVPTVLRLPLLTTYYLLPTTCYYLIPTTRLLQYLQYYCTSCLLPTAYYLLPTKYYLLPTTNYLLPATYYLLPAAYYLLQYLLPATYYLLPTAYYLLPTTYYRLRYLLYLPTTYTVPTTYYLLLPPASCLLLYLLPTTYYLLASADRRILQLGSWPSLLGRVPPLQ